MTALAIFASIDRLPLDLAARHDTDAAFMVAALATVALGPMLINAVVLVRHRKRPDAALPANDGNREF